MTTHPLSGVYAASVTPLKPDLSPDLDAIAPYLAFLASRGCDGHARDRAVGSAADLPLRSDTPFPVPVAGSLNA